MSATQALVYRERVGFGRRAAQGRVGELSRDGIRVCGFASADDAVTAASVAFHALREYLAERIGGPRERLGVALHAAAVTVGATPDGGTDAACFELRFPMRLSAATAVRAAHAIDGALDWWRHRSADVADVGHDGASEKRDDVDEDSPQSFPASDPPGWISMWVGAPTSGEDLEEVV